MGYYMGDASAARHQGGLFSFVGKAIKGIAHAAADILPFPASGIARLVTTSKPMSTLPSLSGMFSPSTPPGIAPTASSSPGTVPVSTPPAVIQAMPSVNKAPAQNLSRAVRPKKIKRAAPRGSKTLVRSRQVPARQRAAALRAHATTTARLRRLGYRV